MERLAEVQQALKCYAVYLVYTTADKSKFWRPWQVIARWSDDSEVFFTISKTADEAVDAALKQAREWTQGDNDANTRSK